MDNAIIIGIVSIVAAVVLGFIGKINQLQSDIKRMNVTLNKIAEEVGVAETTRNIDSELRNLIAEGKEIKAIKRLRMVSGLGLKEAKEYVDNLKY